jgi:hypothetical protein
MMELFEPRRTKKVPIIEVMTQAPPMTSGNSIIFSPVSANKEDRGEHHGRNNGHCVGFEKVSRHTGAVADIVAHIVGDRGRVAGIILGNAGFHLADQIAANVSTLGEDTAAQTGKDRNQRGAEAKGHQRVDDNAVGVGQPIGPVSM